MQNVDISIHAAREGGDFLLFAVTGNKAISIHAAREGGDHRPAQHQQEDKDFNPRRP